MIKIQGDIIEIDGEIYMGTPGLWVLITERNPKEYSSEDYELYKELLYERKVLYRDYDPRSSYPRGNKSKKWTKILRPIWDEEEEENHSTILGNGLYRTYLQGRCFNVYR